LPFVRRPSGGDTLVHDQEVTYALALPPGPRWQGGQPWPARMHAVIAASLRSCTMTLRPACASNSACQAPAMPAPMMETGESP
jgi:lipoate-protein ligase A